MDMIKPVEWVLQDYLSAGPQPPFRGRHKFGRGGRPRHGAIMDRDHPMPMRGQSFLLEEKFTIPYGGRHYEDPYIYGDTARGVKRPYFAVKFTDKEEN
ncbi:hypothetical protein L6452_32829 [Arctium lappa]|uniref:Uncharacterized protein n=1 Tax=Arctium lappa TaxID=4217 RepID=A0ACB8Z6L3_ARCLA|nr:hypothetical protein L6452_32829 [Arctium lappa]